VLMQKVAKERLGEIAKTGFEILKDMNADVSSASGLMKMARLREALLFKKLGARMAAAGKAGVFDTWMLEESDLIQSAARAYGDRLIADRFEATVGSCDTDLKPILEKVLELYLVSNVERNMAQLLTMELIKPQQATEVRARAASLCAEIGPHSLAICDAFAITDSMLSAPIARDWVGYNTFDNQGEIME